MKQRDLFRVPAFHAPRRRRTRIGGLRIENCRPTIRWSNSIEIVERTVSQIFSYPGHSLHSVIEWRKNGTSRCIIKSIKSQAVFLVKIWSMKLIFFKIDFWQVKKCIDSGRFDLNIKEFLLSRYYYFSLFLHLFILLWFIDVKLELTRFCIFQKLVSWMLISLYLVHIN